MQKCILILLGIFIVPNIYAQTNDSAYLAANKYEVKLDGNEQFGNLDSQFYDHQLFLFGENHGSAQPHLLDVELFKHLYAKEKLRYYIAEVDLIKAWMLNQYLKDGQEVWLTKVFKSWKAESAQWASEQNWNKYKKLHVFYQSLPSNQKFSIIGIDVIQDYTLINEYLHHIFNNNIAAVKEVADFIQIADTIQNSNRKILGEFARKLNADLSKNPAYKKTSRKNYPDFTLFMKSAGYIGNGMYRDSIMYRTFEDILVSKNLSKSNMYGFLGFYHTLQVNYEGRSPFAACLKKYSSIKKIVSIQMLAINSTVMLPFNDELKRMMPPSYVAQLQKDNPSFPISGKYIPYELSNDKSQMKIEGIAALKNVTRENSVTIFKLNNTNSPYFLGKKLAEVTGFQTIKMSDKKDVTTDAFQYIVLFRNSPAAIPL